MKFKGRCYKCNIAGTAVVHVTMFVKPVAALPILQFVADTDKNLNTNTNPKTNQGRTQTPTKRAGKQEKVRVVTQQQDSDEGEYNVFYVFSASASEGPETLDLCINDKLTSALSTPRAQGK